MRGMREETGLQPLIWWEVGVMEGEQWRVSILTTFCQNEFVPEKLTDEEPKWFDVNNLPGNIIPNLRWLIPLAFDRLNNEDCPEDVKIKY